MVALLIRNHESALCPLQQDRLPYGEAVVSGQGQVESFRVSNASLGLVLSSPVEAYGCARQGMESGVSPGRRSKHDILVRSKATSEAFFLPGPIF